MPGPQELLVIAVIALLVFGPDRLPELARTAGKWLGKLRSETQRNVSELKRLSEIQQLQAELKGLKRELDDTRHDVTQGVRELSGLNDEAGKAQGAQRRSAGSDAASARRAAAAGVSPRAEDDAPPFDPEAT
ncbi:MAG: twin-arginine translocase TatA/TatE family subunit [Nitriliruptor sp.]|nr:MAG: twin-arginine translocase TatA/TatE family subunit [Nitriliruptor sp.]